MNAKDVKIGELYGWARGYGSPVKVKVTGTHGTPVKGKPQAFTVEKGPETVGWVPTTTEARQWVPTTTEARHLRPWAECEADVQAAQARYHDEQARAQARLDAWMPTVRALQSVNVSAYVTAAGGLSLAIASPKKAIEAARAILAAAEKGEQA